jgi:hypothetical protein
MSKRFVAVNALLVSTTRDKNGGRAKVKFQLTAKVTKALEWPEMPEGTAEWCPDVDELKSSLIEFTPNNDELKHAATSVDASSIGDFIVVRKKKKSGKNSVKADKTITEVICTIRFGDATGCAKLEQYIQAAARSEMLVVYTPQPQQDELPGTRVDMTPEDSQLPLATAEQREAVAEIPDGDPNVEYVERAKERLEKRKAAKGVH